MQSVHISYKNTKKILRISPSDTVRSTTIAAIGLFLPSYSPSASDALPFGLKFKKSMLDSSSLFRYCNIPSNSVLELIELIPVAISKETTAPAIKDTKDAPTTRNDETPAPSSSSSIAGVRVAMSVLTPSLLHSSSSLMATFPSSASLQEIIKSFINEGKLVPYLLDITSVEILIMHLQKVFSRDQFHETTLSSLGLLPGQSIRVQLRLKNDVSTNTATTVIEGKTLSESPEVVEDIPLNGSIAINLSKGALEGAIESNDSDLMDEGSPALPSRSINDTIQYILSNNFDAISIPALLTIGKYLANILSHPTDLKYRTIKQSNRIYVEKVAPCKGTIELLYALGFIENHGVSSGESSIFKSVVNEDRKLCLPNDGDDAARMRLLRENYDILVKSYDELNISESDRPVIVSVQAEAPPIPSQPFDIFRSSITRTAPQPPRVKSATDVQLEAIHKRRRDLEGSLSDVDRDTRVIMPHSEMIPPNSIDDDMNEVPEDSKLVNRVLLKKVLKSGSDEGPPLVTKAIRDLEKAQSERVYSKTLIRVKFPDRLIVQGYFHPRHTMKDVYEWIESCLETNTSDSSDHAVGAHGFELYMSPPKTILKRDDERCLLDQQMVPAAVILLAWKRKTAASSSAGSISAMIAESSASNAVGWYIKTHLLQLSDDKISIRGDDGDKIGYYPHGDELISKKASSSSAREGNNDSMDIDGSAGGKDAKDKGGKEIKSKAKPAWLKI